MHQSLNGTLSIYLTNEIDSVKLHCMFAHIHTYLLLSRGLYHVYICTYVRMYMRSFWYVQYSMHSCMYYVYIAMWSILGHNIVVSRESAVELLSVSLSSISL